MEDDELFEYVETASLVDCTCECSPEDHGWSKCLKCDCLGHWDG